MKCDFNYLTLRHIITAFLSIVILSCMGAPGPEEEDEESVTVENYTMSYGSTEYCGIYGDSANVIKCNGTTYGGLFSITLGGGTTALDISTSLIHTCATLSTGVVSCWTASGSPSPSNVASVTTAEQSSYSYGSCSGSNFYSGCAKLADDTVWCWGSSGGGQGVVQFSGSDLSTVARVSTAPKAVYGSNYDRYFLLNDGTVKASARTTLNTSTFAGLSNVAKISNGIEHACAYKTDGTVECWGNNHDGQLGDGTTTDSGDTPVVAIGISTAIDIAVTEGTTSCGSSITATNSSTCAVLANGRVSCWGHNYTSTPTLINGISDVKQIEGGSDGFTAVTNSNSIYKWATGATPAEISF